MWPNLQFPADLVTFTEEILNEKLHFLCSDNCPEFRNGLLDSYYFKLTLGSGCLELLFKTDALQNHPDSVILQIYQSHSNQSFKHNLKHMPSLSLTLSFLLKAVFVCSSVTFTTQKANAYNPLTPLFQVRYSFFYKQLGSGLSPQSCIYLKKKKKKKRRVHFTEAI